MTHLPALIEDLGLILASAGVVTLVFRKLRQPVVLGYILAGFLVGPHFPYFPNIIEGKTIQVWAEIGVIFLLFALGLEFSFKKLAREGSEASITAAVEVIGMMALGYGTGLLLGWNGMDSLFLGGILSISSTTIIIRAFEELGVKGRGFVSLVFGVLIVEDLFAILILVLFSTIALTQNFVGMEMLNTGLRLIFFLSVIFLLGVFLLPTAIKKLRDYLSDETLLIVSLGLCFLMVMLTTKAGFSPALGAFVMGSLLSETIEGENIDKLIRPVRDLFAAVFFVSVGMLIEPRILITYWVPVVVITTVTVIGKALMTFMGAVLSGRNTRHAVQAGLSLAQIGEFSFIIAELGLSKKVTSEFLYPVAVTVSAISTFTTPYLIKSSDHVYSFLKPHLPQQFIHKRFRPNLPFIEKGRLLKIFANAIIIVAIFIGSSFLTFAPTLKLILAIVFSSPFLWGMLWGGNKKGSVLGKVYSRMEDHFVQNLESNGEETNLQLAPWDAHITSLEVRAHSPVVGQTLENLKIRERFGASIALIERGGTHIPAPTRNEILMPHDKVFVIGTDDQILKLKAEIDLKIKASDSRADYILQKIPVPETSPLCNKTIRQCGIREQTKGLVVGIERNHQRILNPDSSMLIQAGDALWIVGDSKLLISLE